MRELDKMLAGQLYQAWDAELVALRRNARALTRRYNATTEDELDERTKILTELFGSVGSGAFVETPFRCDYGKYIVAGRNLYMNFGCVILDCSWVRIGDDVALGPNVQILAATHPIDPVARAQGPELASPVTIGSQVWIGAGAIVCPGVTIGDGCTIGAGSVVVKDIPPRSVAVGNPCRVIRSI